MKGKKGVSRYILFFIILLILVLFVVALFYGAGINIIKEFMAQRVLP